MRCTTKLIATAGYGVVAVYGTMKAFSWKNTFWKMMAGGIAAVGGIQAARKGIQAKDACEFKRKK